MIDQALTSMAYELLERGEGLTFTARGQSMWPHIHDGDVVQIKPKSGSIEVGQVVFIPNLEFGQLHRVVAVNDDGQLLVRGDALPQADGWFDAHQISGVLGEVSRAGRKINVRRDRSAVRVARVLGLMRRIVHGIRHR